MPDNEYRPDLFEELKAFLGTIPSVEVLSGEIDESGNWWVKFNIDIDHALAWHVVQELGHLLNYMSPTQRLPTVFMPVSAPPYLNGGPREFLSWVIETKEPVPPRALKEILEGHLPQPVSDEGGWSHEPDND